MRHLALLAFLTLLPAAADNPPPSAPDSPPPSATIRGTVRITGELPKPRRIRTDSDPKCASMHRGPLMSDDVVVDRRGNVQWAFVHVTAGLEKKEHEIPKTPVVLTQKGCRFDPHVLGIMAGQELKIRNFDKLMHIVHVRPEDNREWGFSQDRVGDERVKVFDTPERFIRIFCDVHTWMVAWLAVLDHPFYAVTDPRGRFEIKGLPPGTYTVEVWHEKYKPVTQEIEVKARDRKTVDFTLKEGK